MVVNMIAQSQFEMTSFGIVIPAYNEEGGITEIIDRVLAIGPELNASGINLDLIVVDDGSVDRTSAIVREKISSFSASGTSVPLRLVRHPTNKGYGAALKTGFQAADRSPGSLLGFLDADGTYPPEFFPQLCRVALTGADLVVGSRRSGAHSEMPLVRRLGNLIWSSLVSLLSGQRVLDPASGMRVFRSDVLEKLYPLPDGLNFTPVMSTRAVHEGIKVTEAPIPYKERVGHSKLNVVKDGLRFLQTILWTAMNYNPVRILGGVGAALILLALSLAGVLIGMRITGITHLGPVGVGATYTAMVSGIAGVNLFVLGITFNYLVSLFHKRPERGSLFGKPLLKQPLEQQFWWMGLLLITCGLAMGAVSFYLGVQPSPSANGIPSLERLWLYLLASSMLILLGMQLFIFWVIVQVLNELNQRESRIQSELGGH